MAVDNPSYFSLQHSTSSSSSVNSSNPATARFSGFFRRSKPVGKARTAPVLTACNQPRVPTISASMTFNASEKRNLRSLFRSASTNSDCERTRQFLKGEPRPSDVAPPSPYLNNRSQTEGRGKSRRRALKSSSELLNMDMVFCGLPSESASTSTSSPRRTQDNDYYRFERDSEYDSEATTVPIDELEDEPSYYNVTSTLPHTARPPYSSMGRHKTGHLQPKVRRHSVGTFLDQERCTMVLNAKQPQQQQDLVVEPRTDVVDHADNCAKFTRINKHGTRHAPATFSSPKPLSSDQASASALARDDVVFISSKDDEAAALWVNYLTACFEQISRQQGRPPFRVFHVSIEEALTPGIELKIRTARLQIIVVCPMFLERVSEHPEQATALSRQLCAERILAMMLGVQETQVSAAQRANLLGYLSWRKFFVKDQDETFVGQFLGAAMAILGAAATSNLKVDKTGFSVHPKKVKMGQNRVLALLNEPLHPDDTVTVMIDRCGEALEINHVKRRNPYTLQFSIPERCLDVSMLVGVRIARNGAPLGVRQVKCESRLRELDQILRAHDNPLEFMCQTFGFNSGDKEQLDNWMVHAFQKNIPPHFNLLSNPPGDLQLSKNHSSSEENPTLLHFAARFGLEKLAWQLLECPGGDIACDMKNVNDLTPADLSDQAGHVKLAHQLRGYMQMNEFSNMYSYLKVMSENANESGNGLHSQHNTVNEECRQEDYCRPRPLSEAYSVPPIARPVLPRTFPDYSTPPPLPQPNPTMQSMSMSENEDSATPMASYTSSSTLNGSGSELPLQGYMQMNPAGLRTTTATTTATESALSTPTTVTSLSSSQLINHTIIGGECTPSTSKSCKNEDNRSKSNRSSQSSSKSTRESPQDELLEIITDFKNNVFTISEVERLVANWHNRNDVQQSFKDKQRQLAAMRDEYERIQKRIKDDMKAPTPFDRIRKFFTKGKKGDSKESVTSSDDATPSKPNGISGNLADRRPVSSLSLHSVSSSSSSGRMSTVSGCSGTSMGDSGTHSDTDDRRLQHPISDEKATCITSYEIPPAPKPFNAATCKLFNNGRCTPTLIRNATTMGCPSVNSSELDLRPVKSSHPALDDKEYYIAFPPCGLPVHSFKPNVSKEPKTPSTPLEYANVLVPPPGMCIPSFQYVNLNPPKSDLCGNLVTVQPEIHAEPPTAAATTTMTTTTTTTTTTTITTTKEKEKINGDENEVVGENENEQPVQPDSPKIINTEAMPDYTNVKVAASEDIARNFGVTLKKLPGPPVPPRCEFNFSTAGDRNGVKANEE